MKRHTRADDMKQLAVLELAGLGWNARDIGYAVGREETWVSDVIAEAWMTQVEEQNEKNAEAELALHRAAGKPTN